MQSAQSFFSCQDFEASDRNLLKSQFTNANSYEFEHRMADRLKHPAYLPVLSLTDCQFEPGVLFGGANFPDDGGRSDFSAANVHTKCQLEILIRSYNTSYLAVIGFPDFRFGLE